MGNAKIVVFGTTPTEADLAEVREDLAHGFPIPMEQIREDDFVRIATVWACFNKLRYRFAKDTIADLMEAYLGADEVVSWYHRLDRR